MSGDRQEDNLTEGLEEILGPKIEDTLDLDSEIAVYKGKPPTEAYWAFERQLTPADIEALVEGPSRSLPPRSIARIHASHHSLARCLATGMKHQQAALITGYSLARVATLVADPAFQSLVEDYKSELKGIYADLNARMADMSLDAMELLQEKIHANPEELTIPALLEIIKTFADRTGHGPGQEVKLKVEPQDLIDRPPRENFEEWQKRRQVELAPPVSVEQSGDETVADLVDINLEALAPPKRFN